MKKKLEKQPLHILVCVLLDKNIGDVLSTLDNSEFADNTNVIYTSDHGDALGMRGMWGKSTMFEESAGIPMIMRGPDIPKGKKIKTPVSLVDVFPTVIDNLKLTNHKDDRNLPGKSLIEIANNQDDYERIVLSEYHAAASPVGALCLGKVNLNMCILQKDTNLNSLILKMTNLKNTIYQKILNTKIF